MKNNNSRIALKALDGNSLSIKKQQQKKKIIKKKSEDKNKRKFIIINNLNQIYGNSTKIEKNIMKYYLNFETNRVCNFPVSI